MGGKYELRCFEPIHFSSNQEEYIEYFDNWFKMRKAYREKKKQYARIYLIVRKVLKLRFS